MKRVKNILYTGTTIILILLITAVAIGKAKGCHLYVVKTGSMEPELPVGSIIGTIPAEIGQLAVGDNISYVRDESLVVITHRIIEIDAAVRQVITQGTANPIPDSPVQAENILGKVLLCIPYIGYPALYLSDTKAKIIAVITIAAIILLGLVLNKRKNI